MKEMHIFNTYIQQSDTAEKASNITVGAFLIDIDLLIAISCEIGTGLSLGLGL